MVVIFNFLNDYDVYLFDMWRFLSVFLNKREDSDWGNNLDRNKMINRSQNTDDNLKEWYCPNVVSIYLNFKTILV